MGDSIAELGFDSRLDPVDEHAAHAIEGFRRQVEAVASTSLLWPSASYDPVPVTAIANRAGWAHRSPLGLGIHPEFGLWMAYRGVVLIAAPALPRRAASSASPCDSCEDRPCISSCPVGAVGGPDGLAVVPCFDERQRPGAPCGDGCRARLACPVGAAHRYGFEQLRHHTAAAVRSWRRSIEDGVPAPPPEWRRR